ncbi:MAG: hypothetical protein AB7T31_18110 [Gemmatimonadales bacterium]
MLRHRARGALFLAGMLLVPAVPLAAQGNQDLGNHAAVLKREHPEVYDLMIRIERAHGIVFGALAPEGEAVRARGDSLPTYGFELDMVERLTALVNEKGQADDVAEEAAAGYAVLGPRAAQIIARGNAFYREILGILADRTVTNRNAELAAAVERYRSRPELALPAKPKNMDVLYDHSYALDFRGGYADLDGFLWAGHWLDLAVSEPLTDFAEPDRRLAGLDTVRARYFAKLTYGEPPEFFPSEVPLAPAIAPGLIFLSPQAAMIWDNLNMMQEVLADVLASPQLDDLHAAIDETVDWFMDPENGTTDQDFWEIMALRHGIFFQGGYPIAVMTESERNLGGHAAHLQEGAVPIMSGMPG